MKTIGAIFVVVLFSVALANALPPKETESTSWAGNFQDKNFLKGRAVLQLKIIQEGGHISVDFDAVYNNGQGCAPEANAMAKTVDKNTLQFNFTTAPTTAAPVRSPGPATT